MNENSQLARHYGPWAVIAGASEGTGRAFAEQIAASGINCILIARRSEPLQTLAEHLQATTDVRCVTVAVDLAAADAFKRIKAATDGREVGLFVANAGADPNGAHFLDRDSDTWMQLINRGITTTVQCCHYFAGAMRERQRGGILLVGSGACYGGGSYLAVYSATKAFTLNFAESLWAELRPYHIDVLYLSLSQTDTPAFSALLADKGLPVPPHLTSPEEAASAGLSHLPHGPVHNYGQTDDQAGYAPSSASDRRRRVEAIDASTRQVFGDG